MCVIVDPTMQHVVKNQSGTFHCNNSCVPGQFSLDTCDMYRVTSRGRSRPLRYGVYRNPVTFVHSLSKYFK